MPFTLTMPKMSPTMEQGTIIKWHKKEGEFVNADELLFEVATDKATVEYNALDSGWLRQILLKNNTEAKVNQPIAIFTEDKEESIEDYKAEGADTAPHTSEVQSKAPDKPAASVSSEPARSHGERLKISPLARKLAKQQGLDLSSLLGTGPGGRIISRDLANARSLNHSHELIKPFTTAESGSYFEEELTPMRKVISQRLQEAKASIPHFYVSMKINAQPLVDIRAQLKLHGISLTYNDFIVKASALALKKHPGVNSGFNAANNTLIRFKTIDISIAVSIPGGLITPIVKHADLKPISDLAAEIKALSARAKEGKLESHEYKGGSFTISNLGMYGVSDFIAIINPPQAAILAVSGILSVPVVRNGVVVPGNELVLTLSGDHRVIDGVAGAEFLKTLQSFLEAPAVLLDEVYKTEK
ncbi:MAG: 2-oxo acid dehydrogenase subunit E2 [Parachlamydiaceae bacterium]|nr:2-oxo acid dehydrogenase subunit E2 [Parachlamydiaceae bacterium]